MPTFTGTIVVTGANGGLGTAILDGLVARPDLASCHGIYTVRNLSSTSNLQSSLRHERAASHPHEIVPLDLSNPASVREAAATINAKVQAGEIPQIQALILNAGYRETKKQTWTDDGLDKTFATNYIGHWLLTMLLLQSMKRDSGRVVIVSSGTHDPLDPGNRASGAFVDEQWQQILADGSSRTVEAVAQGKWSATSDPIKDPQGLSGLRRYGAAKLCSVMMIVELQRRLDQQPELSGISVVGVDPGTMPTTITTGRHNWLVKMIFTAVIYIAAWISPNGIMRTTRKSASDVLAAATSGDPPIGRTPKSLYLNGSEPKAMSVEVDDDDKRAAVWKAGVKYSQLKEGETILAQWS
ncbi:putative short-chain dehydrogenase [Xylaria sp. FL1777]|nr:putative short-chain dehydrogenase [Xylaria sp. FL1777]